MPERKIPEVGHKAPAFNLLDQDSNKLTLADFSGEWLVLYFYPKDDTPGCTTEACEFTESIRNFTSMKAQVVGVSPDTVEKHQKFIAKYKLKVRLLSDPDHKVMEKYGAWGIKKNYGREYEGVLRSSFLIAPDGKIAHVWPNVKAAGHAAKVRDKLKELSA
jgi:peroxiredoxin Q/BCP